MNDASNVTNTHNGHEFVDLGLPSRTLWATCNVGATSPEQAGLYFAFGETEGFTAEQVMKGERSFDSASYTTPSVSENLNLEQDAAHIYMGGKWRMPTVGYYQELIANCNVVETDDYGGTGVAGRVFTSKVNGNSVFLPAAGYCYKSAVRYVGSRARYWSASWDSPSLAWRMHFDSEVQGLDYTYRLYGYSVRGVCEK